MCRRKNGETFHASILATPVDSTDGGAPRLMILIIDDERERNRDRFLATVVHDLRQPLSLIATTAYLLEQREQPGATRKMLARIERAAAQLSDLSTDILDLAAARLGDEVHLRREHLNLIEVLDEVCGDLAVVHAERLISIESADAVTGHWDRKRLRRLAQNLVENSLQHSPPATPVRISCQRIGGDIVLAVENECPERPAAILEHLNRHSETVSETPSLPFSTQRRHRRVSLESELEVSVRDQVFRARGRDVSLRGLAFWSDVDVKVDERIQVGVSTGPTSFRVLGTVRHVNRATGRSLVGIEFPCDLSPADIELLKKPLRS